jgi:hypothetical protein
MSLPPGVTDRFRGVSPGFVLAFAGTTAGDESSSAHPLSSGPATLVDVTTQHEALRLQGRQGFDRYLSNGLISRPQ